LSDHDAYQDEMGRFFGMSDRDLERLLAGKAVDDEELAEFAAFLREVEAAHLKFPRESTEARQLLAILEAAQFHGDKGEPVARPASKAPGPGPQASRLPNWRRTLMPTGLLSTMWSKAAVAAVAAFFAMAGLAAAGALPDPLQTAAANAADQVGVSLDNPSDVDEPGDVDAVDEDKASEPDDDGAKDDDDAKGEHNNNSDSHPVSTSNDTPPAPAVTTSPPANGNDDTEDDDHASSNPAADDDNEAEDDDDEAKDDDEEADDEAASEPDDHESEDKGESDDD
jgi:hypothetical protein